ncbi:MAG: hypothetical protein KUG79_12140 [Pseudomonadales bacterium]|nr:hypothetical protein [Pseudomonadales bacterium]
MSTSTAEWTMVIQRVSQSTVQVWVGTLYPALKMPDAAKVMLSSDDGKKSKGIKKSDWQRPFSSHTKRFYRVLTFKNLAPDTQYKLEFQRQVPEQSGTSWQVLKRGTFKTLPESIPTDVNKPFTIGLGSCFYNHRDGGRAAASYKALYENGPAKVSPDITILAGDQVYLDIGFDSLSLRSAEIRERIADDYARHWQALGSMFTRGATWMIPDDHEYWNDYPNYRTNIPTLQALRKQSVRSAWTRAAIDGVSNVQQARPIEMFRIGTDLDVCLADLRSNRTESQFLADSDMAQLLDWARGLVCTGVLVIPQPLIVDENKDEKNLRSYPEQYSELLAAMSSSGHDIVVLSGDVHFGRICSVSLGPAGGKLVEIVSSPMSNLTYLNGIATATPKLTPKTFPPTNIQIPGLPSTKVTYDKAHTVSTRKGYLLSSYPKRRTSEHFMTVSFSKSAQGGLKLVANAWRIRERAKGSNLPAKDFSKPFRIEVQ